MWPGGTLPLIIRTLCGRDRVGCLGPFAELYVSSMGHSCCNGLMTLSVLPAGPEAAPCIHQDLPE